MTRLQLTSKIQLIELQTEFEACLAPQKYLNYLRLYIILENGYRFFTPKLAQEIRIKDAINNTVELQYQKVNKDWLNFDSEITLRIDKYNVNYYSPTVIPNHQAGQEITIKGTKSVYNNKILNRVSLVKNK